MDADLVALAEAHGVATWYEDWHRERRDVSAESVIGVLGLWARHPGELTLVFMGMGEPLHNLRQVVRAIEVLTASRGLAMSARRITVSTSGLVPQIEELGRLLDRRELLVLVARDVGVDADELGVRLAHRQLRFSRRTGG